MNYTWQFERKVHRFGNFLRKLLTSILFRIEPTGNYKVMDIIIIIIIILLQ